MSDTTDSLGTCLDYQKDTSSEFIWTRATKGVLRMHSSLKIRHQDLSPEVRAVLKEKLVEDPALPVGIKPTKQGSHRTTSALVSDVLHDWHGDGPDDI